MRRFLGGFVIVLAVLGRLVAFHFAFPDSDVDNGNVGSGGGGEDGE